VEFHHVKNNNACHMAMHMHDSHSVAMRVPGVSE
jgi:hypothetical protein